MTDHRLVFLQLSDRAGYAQYRKEMAPLLARYGGQFVLDAEGGAFHVHPADFEPDRVLLIAFPDADRADAFFVDPAYIAIRARWFVPSVARTDARRLSPASP